MIQLKDISVEELFNLPENQFLEYQRILSNLKPKPFFGHFKSTEFIDLNFGEVSEIMESLDTLEGLTNVFCSVFKMKQSHFKNGKCTDFFYAFNWIKSQIKQIQETEEFAFNHKDFSGEAEKWKEANQGRLDKFGILNATVMLGKQFGVLPSQIEALPYHEVFGMLYHGKEFSQVQKEFNNLMMKNNGI